MRLLLSRGADVNRRGGPGRRRPRYMRRLALARECGVLIQAGADVNMCGGHGGTPSSHVDALRPLAGLGGEHAERRVARIEPPRYVPDHALLTSRPPARLSSWECAESRVRDRNDFNATRARALPQRRPGVGEDRARGPVHLAPTRSRLARRLVPAEEASLRLRSQIARKRGRRRRTARALRRGACAPKIARRVLAFWNPRRDCC